MNRGTWWTALWAVGCAVLFAAGVLVAPSFEVQAHWDKTGDFTIQGGLGVGVSTTPLPSKLSLRDTNMAMSGISELMNARFDVTPLPPLPPLPPQTSSTASTYGLSCRVITGSSNTVPIDGLHVGIFGKVHHRGSARLEEAKGVFAEIRCEDTTIAIARPLIVRSYAYNNGTIEKNYGITISRPDTAGTIPGTILENYGLFIEDQSRVADSYAIYADGGQTYFKDQVGIGVRKPNEELDIEGDIGLTGSIYLDGIRFLHNYGTQNTFAGQYAGNFSTTGSGLNTGVGVSALRNNTDGSANTAAGAGTLSLNTTGSHNTSVGASALGNNTTGSQNTAVGADALHENTVGESNTAFGMSALHWNTASDNTAIGARALKMNTTGSSNTAVGDGALQGNETGSRNAALGDGALFANTAGGWNTAIGSGALASNSTSDGNTAVGHSALTATTGIGSTGYNTAVGVDALDQNTTGHSNTAVGSAALHTNATGTKNTALGIDADVSTGDLTNATAIGFGAVVDTSNKVRIGNSSVTVIEGQVDWTYTSDRNAKERFLPVDGSKVLERLMTIPVTSWNFVDQDVARFRHYGCAAQDFFAAFGHDGLGTIGSETTLTGSDVDGILMAAIQGMHDLLMEKEAEINALRAEMDELRQLVESLL